MMFSAVGAKCHGPPCRRPQTDPATPEQTSRRRQWRAGYQKGPSTRHVYVIRPWTREGCMDCLIIIIIKYIYMVQDREKLQMRWITVTNGTGMS